MKIETGTIQVVTLVLTEPEARSFLADPGPTQDAVRNALSSHYNGSQAKVKEPRVVA